MTKENGPLTALRECALFPSGKSLFPTTYILHYFLECSQKKRGKLHILSFSVPQSSALPLAWLLGEFLGKFQTLHSERTTNVNPSFLKALL